MTAWRSHRSGEPTVDELLNVLAVDRLETNVFAGTSMTVPRLRVFGGQTLAQCAVAASLTVAPPAVLHSMHAYFVRPGRPSAEFRFEVSTLRDGRSFAARRVEALQDGEPACVVITSFHVPEDGLAHQDGMPERPSPADLPGRTPFHIDPDGPANAGAVELRACPPSPEDPRRPEASTWMRVTAPLPDDPLLHQALLIYLSDFGILHGAFRHHGVSRSQIRTASLDHGIWLHHPGRADDWLLYDTRSPASGGGRAIGFATMYSASGVLLATASQEMLVRSPDRGVRPRPPSMARNKVGESS